jgi:transposase
MKIDITDVGETINEAKKLLKKEKNISPALRAIFNVILVLMHAMLIRFSLNSKNSSKAPSTDPNRKKSNHKKKSKKRKPGGQLGRKGIQLKPVSNPDKVEVLKLDKRSLPRGNYTEVGCDKRQVIDIETNVIITEYQAQILEDTQGKRYTAAFPSHVSRPIQYGPKTKSRSVYLSQYQLTPYKRIENYFVDQIGLSVSEGSIFNFNKEAYELLSDFEAIAKERLIQSARVNADETGINLNGKRIWLHTACNDRWTHFYPHQKRGHEAIDAIGIIPKFKGILCHDHWKAYYRYDCLHSLCNSHHLRELIWSATEDKQAWAKKLDGFLRKLNITVDKAGGSLEKSKADYYRKRYRAILSDAQKECPPSEVKRKKGQRGRLKQSKSRNLLERLINYEDDVLRFMENKNVPFTNNQGENDLRMTKVQQKISGCFRSEQGALIFCRIRAYLITCRKHDVSATDALQGLFNGKLPDFVSQGE